MTKKHRKHRDKSKSASKDATQVRTAPDAEMEMEEEEETTSKPTPAVKSTSNATKEAPKKTVDMSLAHRLTSPDKTIRDGSIRKLRQFLHTKKEMSEMDMMKIWKGIFYCFWMSDKVPIQHELADRIASLMHPLSYERSLMYQYAFYATMSREWTGIDRLRLDKFMTFVRKFWQQTLVWCQTQGWKPDVVSSITSMLSATALHHATFNRGLFLHMCDVMIDEIAITIPPSHAFHTILELFFNIFRVCNDDAMIKRVSEQVFQPMIDVVKRGLQREQQDQDDEEEHESHPHDTLQTLLDEDMINYLSQHLFELASDAMVPNKSRTILYNLQQQCEELTGVHPTITPTDASSKKRKASSQTGDLTKKFKVETPVIEQKEPMKKQKISKAEHEAKQAREAAQTTKKEKKQEQNQKVPVVESKERDDDSEQEDDDIRMASDMMMEDEDDEDEKDGDEPQQDEDGVDDEDDDEEMDEEELNAIIAKGLVDGGLVEGDEDEDEEEKTPTKLNSKSAVIDDQEDDDEDAQDGDDAEDSADPDEADEGDGEREGEDEEEEKEITPSIRSSADLRSLIAQIKATGELPDADDDSDDDDDFELGDVDEEMEEDDEWKTEELNAMDEQEMIETEEQEKPIKGKKGKQKEKEKEKETTTPKASAKKDKAAKATPAAAETPSTSTPAAAPSSTKKDKKKAAAVTTTSTPDNDHPSTHTRSHDKPATTPAQGTTGSSGLVTPPASQRKKLSIDHFAGAVAAAKAALASPSTSTSTTSTPPAKSTSTTTTTTAPPSSSKKVHFRMKSNQIQEFDKALGWEMGAPTSELLARQSPKPALKTPTKTAQPSQPLPSQATNTRASSKKRANAADFF